jgi:GNAT superfamily N-acetyltransferase
LLDLFAAFHAQHVALCPLDYRPALERGAVAAMIEAERRSIAVATVNGSVVGYAWHGLVDRPGSALTPPARLLFVHQAFVGEAHRRNGVGRKLFAFLDALASALGAHLALDCAVANEGALAFFRREGFQPSTLIMRTGIGKRPRQHIA